MAEGKATVLDPAVRAAEQPCRYPLVPSRLFCRIGTVRIRLLSTPQVPTHLRLEKVQ